MENLLWQPVPTSIGFGTEYTEEWKEKRTPAIARQHPPEHVRGPQSSVSPVPAPRRHHLTVAPTRKAE